MKLNRLEVIYMSPPHGDRTYLKQYHRNGSDKKVAEIELDGDELEDAIYSLQRMKAQRDKYNHETGSLL